MASAEGSRSRWTLVVGGHSRRDTYSSAGLILRAARSTPAGHTYLNSLNRRMRTRMSGGVGGEQRGSLAAPYPDYITPFRERSPVALRLAGQTLILDGGFATELEHRGHDVSGHLWSAQLLIDSPDAIEQLHYDYFAAGADCVISGSYQASYEGFSALGLTPDEVTSLLRSSVILAQAARSRYEENRSGRRLYVAASVGPYGATLHDGSEYHGNYGLTTQELREFHARRFDVLAGSGADLLACETLPSLDEATALAELLREHSTTSAWFSFTSLNGVDTAHGEPLSDCARFLDSTENIVAVGVNCIHPRFVSSAIEQLKAGTDKAIVVYPNSGEKWDVRARNWRGSPSSSLLADLAPLWVEQGARLIGGCCRTGTRDIAAIAAAIKGDKLPA